MTLAANIAELKESQQQAAATDKGRAMMDVMVNLQAQIIAFSHDYQMVMIFTLCAIPLAIMIGSTKASLRKQSLAPDHAVIE